MHLLPPQTVALPGHRWAPLLLLGVLLPSPAFAVTFRVLADGTGHFDTIQQALDAAADGDIVQVGPGTWAEALTFDGTAVTLRSTDGAGTTVLDGGGAGYALRIVGDPTVEGFTIQNAGAGGLAISGGSPTLTDLYFEDLGNTDLAGGAVVVTQGSPTFSGCTFSGGIANQGAHLYIAGGTVTILDSELAGGVATYGGSISLYQGELVLDGVSIHDNEAGVHGGGVYTYASTTTRVTDSSFADNVMSTGTTYGYGGGVFLGEDASLVAERVTFTGNGSPDYATTYAYGGGLFLEASSDAELTDVTLDANLAYYGGGVYQNNYASLAFTGALLTANYAYYGGAIWVSYGEQLSLTDTAVDANTSLYNGAGMYVSGVNGLYVTNSTFTENLATYGSGAAGIVYYAGTVSLAGSTLDGNLAYYTGGGLYLYDIDTVTLDAVTATDNAAIYGDGGALYLLYAPAVSVSDSVFDGNTAYYGGGALSTTGGIDVRGSVFTDNVAELRSGGALLVDTDSTASVRFVDTRFEDNTAGGDGGAAAVTDAGSLTLDGATLADNTAANAGGALYVVGAGSRTVRGSAFTGNRAGFGGGVYVSGAAAPDAWTNTIVQDNEAGAGGGACFLETTGTTLTNNVVVGNSASDDGAALYLYDAVVDARNVVFAYNTGAAAVYAWDAPDGLSFAYDDWYDNSGGDLAGALDVAELDATNRTDAPGFVAWSANGDATDDSFVLWRSSALLDAGDPFLQDWDGSASDIGVYSGPGVTLEDADGDGVYAAWDCDDTDPTVAPGAADPWYDGVDQDCQDDSDYDQDRDGQDALAYGGEDCDDLDFGVTGPCDTAAPHPEDTGGVDADTGDTPAVDEAAPEGCGCDTGGSGALWWAWGLVGLIGRRRLR